jgi:hypothetical protein
MPSFSDKRHQSILSWLFITPTEKLIYFHKTIQKPSEEIIGKGQFEQRLKKIMMAPFCFKRWQTKNNKK